MKLKEKSNEFGKVLFGLIQLDIQHFNVSRSASANLSVRGVLHQRLAWCHEPDRTTVNGIRELLLKILPNVFFCAPVTPSS